MTYHKITNNQVLNMKIIAWIDELLKYIYIKITENIDCRH